MKDEITYGKDAKGNKLQLITCAGKTRSMREWSEETGKSISAIRHRLNSGMSIKDALFTPSKKKPPEMALPERVKASALYASGDWFTSAKMAERLSANNKSVKHAMSVMIAKGSAEGLRPEGNGAMRYRKLCPVTNSRAWSVRLRNDYGVSI